jgi:hypothetical protein
MDWLEQWFGLNPDGGDGSIETALVLAAVVVVLTIGSLMSARVRGVGAAWLARMTRRSKTAD